VGDCWRNSRGKAFANTKTNVPHGKITTWVFTSPIINREVNKVPHGNITTWRLTSPIINKER
jgi:hypothetical protein